MSDEKPKLLAAKVDAETHDEAHRAAKALGTSVAQLIKQRLASAVAHAKKQGLI